MVDGYGQEPAATEAELIGIGEDDVVKRHLARRPPRVVCTAGLTEYGNYN